MTESELPILDEFNAEGVMERCRFSVDFSFYGVPVRLYVTSAREAEQWQYFFKYHLGQKVPAKIEVFFEVEEYGESFIESIFRKNYKTKAMYIRQDGRMRLWSRFDVWSGVASPLPPFTMPPLNERIWTLNASSVRTPSGNGVAFVAPPYQGKSTLANAVLVRGGVPLSDNLTVISATEPIILPYLTPTGVREETVAKISALHRAVATMKMPFVTVSEITGTVYLLHFDEIAKFPPPSPSLLSDIVFLDNRRDSMDGRFELFRIDGNAAISELSSHCMDMGVADAVVQARLSRLRRDIRAHRLVYDLRACDLDKIVDAILG